MKGVICHFNKSPLFGCLENKLSVTVISINKKSLKPAIRLPNKNGTECPMELPKMGAFKPGCILASAGPGILGTTWEPDECLPPHLDDIRLREKRAWIKRRKDAGAQVALEAGKVERWKHKRELERGNLLRNQIRWMHLVLGLLKERPTEGSEVLLRI